MTDYFSDPRLLASPPIKRAAYSDRTAWILAEISRLVYDPLPAELSIQSLVEDLKEGVKKGTYRSTVEGLIRKIQGMDAGGESAIVQVLEDANFSLVDSFAKNGTEALLAKLEPQDGFEGMLVLAFRGTQPNVQDVLTDIKADLDDAPHGGRAHRGFLEAFGYVQKEIQEALDKHAGLPVYITGHSLGGALAMLATRYLAPNSIGATYTYGCPRAADEVFYEKVKTPVYGIINCADAVPRVPFGFGFSFFLYAIRFIPINGTDWISQQIRKRFSGYTHYGSLRMLSAPPNELDEYGIPFKGLVLKESPNVFWRITQVVRRLASTGGRAAVNDHAIRAYSEKLRAYAQRRNVIPSLAETAKAPEEPAQVA